MTYYYLRCSAPSAPFDNPTKTMPVRIQDVEGVTSQLDAYIGAGEGPLEQRKHDVEQLFRDRVTGDLSLLLCPAPGEVDPGLWGVMISSLLTPTEGETTARAQRASILVAEIREATRLRDQRIRSKRTRAAKKQAGYICLASVDLSRVAWALLCFDAVLCACLFV